MPSESPTLSAREKLAYGLGDTAANFVFQTQITFLLYFYTDVFGIAAGTAGTILLVSRIVDALNDPVIGGLADRTITRWGRYRPWVLATALPMAIALVLCYTTPPFGTTGKIVWAIVTYNLLMIAYAANNIPYSALSGVMTDSSVERTSLASWRFLCSMVAALLVNVFTLDLVRYFGGGDATVGFPRTMALWGCLAVVLFTLTWAFTRERVEPLQRGPTPVRQDLSDLLRNGPWLALFVISVLISIHLSIRSGSILYYFTHCLRRENLFGLFNAVSLAFLMIGIAGSQALVARFGKRNTFRTCLVISAVLMSLFALLPPEATAAIFALQALLQLAMGPTVPMLWAMMADVADYSEWHTGRRSTALVFATIAFGGKLGFGIGGWLSGELLECFGYTASAADLPASATRGIVLMVSVFPAIALLIGVGVLFFYGIDRPTERQMEESLRERRERTKEGVSL